jgi:thioredoxin reductase (NADPH)
MVGAGVFYGAAIAEAPAVRDRHVFIAGGGNSAGQAALHLAKYAASVTLLVRGHGLAESMSEYLITAIAASTTISIRTRTEIVDGEGPDHLHRLTLRHTQTGRLDTVAADALFVLIGAAPHTSWLPEGIVRDEWGFIVTGSDLLAEGRMTGWPLARSPMLLESSIPGVFAVGDVRHRSIKRVASAVGEGSTAIALVHEYLAPR